ncbi:MAG: B12-binding domain-containing radical SAM protein [Candidatus Pacebacteria bacterium]|nr:B12-binding domain-containing radical SAM protein [Candidatus Paceibacterota bacterium]NUQ57070.1 B12-binding domain-containing radical SAM protein [Candidatus Paceibacter sp.]
MKIFFIEARGTSKYLHNGLAYLTGSLKDRHDVKIFDLNILDWSGEKIIEAAREQKPDIIGFSMKSFNLKNVLALAEKIKEVVAAKLIVGGPHITVAAKDFFGKDNNEVFDFGYQGEGDVWFARFCDNFSKPEEYKNIPGLIYSDKGVWQFNANKFIQNLDDISYPDFDCFEGGVDFESQDGYPLLTSRGCPYQCIYCSVSKVSGRIWRFRSPKNIIGELKRAVEEYEIKKFKIIDDNFTLNIERAKEFCRILIKEKMNLAWSCPNGLRADRLDDELVRLMKEAGCKEVSLGIESGDEKVFDFINKGEKLSAIENAVKILKEHKLKVDAFFIVGLPFETIKSIKKSIKLIGKLGIDNVKWNMLVPYPQTALWDWVVKNGRVLKNFTSGQHFSREKGVEPIFETSDYSARQRIKAYKIANLSTGAYQYVFKRPKNKWLFYLKYSFYLLRYNPGLFFKKVLKKLNIKEKS